ncbi:hypothetical protein RclHR1_17290004 [Rhizophagus clarus]|uniref:Uncharacterized protein n=1 Tax=Rhizophagus clarus TaxID=94130 RepID=A0A2Z6R070_9GLOM|nr:hypothetical protein RclHR1_17290004 [Rhizophagus clarus]GES73154.1 hypothetical protein GLOIN_2v1632724 [Rhizophagus clarus]
MKHLIFTIIFFATTLLTVNALALSQCSGNYPNPVNVSSLPDPPVAGQYVDAFISMMAYTTVEVSAYDDIQVSKSDLMSSFTFQLDICNDNYVNNCTISNYYLYNNTFLVINESLAAYIKARLYKSR